MAINDHMLGNILELFSVLVLVDQKISPEEPGVFESQYSRIWAFVDDDVIFSPQMATNWFENNRVYYEHKLNQLDARKLIDISLFKLRTLPQNVRHQLLYALIRISWADQEFHQSEQALVERAAQIWKLEYTSSKKRIRSDR